MIKDYTSYFFLRTITFPISFLPYRAIHLLGNIFGYISFFLLRKYRKRTLSNLSLAKDLKIEKKDLKKIGIKSFQNLAINILEYPKFSREKKFSKIIKCINPEKAIDLYNKKQGIIFFCGHQANWEVLFIDGNIHMKGVAIGRPIKNKILYNWVVSIREKTGGKIIKPKKALKEGLKALKEGKFLGIVGDQGMPESDYEYPLFGKKSSNSSAPALLSYKTGSPIIVAMTKRKKGKYYITYSDPIWPNYKNDITVEIPKLMDQSLSILEKSIKENIDQWLWIHNKWKKQTPKYIKKGFRFDTLAIILPKNFIKENLFTLKTLDEIYQKNFTTIYIHKEDLKNHAKEINNLKFKEKIYYEEKSEIFIKNYSYKLVLDFTNTRKIKRFFKKLSAEKIYSQKDIYLIYKKKHKDNIKQNKLEKLIAYTISRNPKEILKKAYASK